DGWIVLRPAGAAARAMLIEEAAARWNVAADDCTTRLGAVIHRGSGNSAAYGELADGAATRKPPRNPALRDPATFRIVGASPPRPDTPPKVNGSAGFGIDVRLDGMLTAAIRHAPSFGGTVAAFDKTAIESRPGVVRALTVGDAVAVVADGYWRANAALVAGEEAGEFAFAAGAAAALDNDAVVARLAADLAENRGKEIESEGDLGLAMSIEGARVLEAEYRLPFLAHATMEPMNCTARVGGGGCEIWIGTQAPDIARDAAAKAAGVSAGDTVVHNAYLGGGFGRRSEGDVAAEAAAIARELPGIPVKLLWSREEDLRHDFYRPAAMARMAGAVLPQTGTITAWRAQVASAPMLAAFAKRNLGILIGNLAALAADRFEVGEAIRPAYPIANRQIAWTASETPVPTGNWRSVSNSFGAFASESFCDELAAEMDAEPLALRLRMLAEKPRHRAVLELAAGRAGWGEPIGENQGRGIAIHESFGTIVAHVIEVTVPPQGWLRVDRVTSAVDAGFVVNPDGLRAQIESAVIYGLSAALYGDVMLVGGAVQQGNFDSFEVLGMLDAPPIDVHLAPNGGPIGGGGEPGLPPVAPALANAVFAASGRRIRALPFRAHGLA
ncbi:MAG: molybdopterin-dependent oxidoreductase, partial [Proteobacteria bacterium]|nr:molybdopterin-dependent oxidoreductase [Pseudomonadota bacterium]